MDFCQKLKYFLDKIISYTLNLIYKRKCVHCACSINYGILCKTCSKNVQNLPSFAQGIVNGYKIFSAYSYENVVKSMLHALKFKHNKEIAGCIAEYTVEYLEKLKKEINPENAIIIPVPAHKSTIGKRGYDHVFEISKEIAQILNIEINHKALRRIKSGIPLYKIKARQRRKNLEGAFELDKDFSSEKLIILYDDIVTTGATLEIITDLFKRKGVKNLICLTFSKTKKF